MLVTQILSSMTVMLCMLIDSIMIGRFLGVDSMTAYGFATPVLLVFAALGNMISAGIQVLCGKTMGCGDKKGTNAGFTVSVFLATAIAVGGMIIILVFTNPICELLGAGKPTPDNDVFFLTRDYLRGFIIGAPAFIGAQIMVPYMQMSGNQPRLVIAVALMTVSDIIFDILNVTVFDGGTFGMGLASSLSYYFAFTIGILYFFKKECIFRLRPKLFKARVCGELVRDGFPTLVNQVSLVLLTFVLNKLLAYVGGNHAVAAYSVITSVGNICYSFGSGIASVSLMLSSIFYSDEDKSSLRSLVKTMTFYSFVICSSVTAIVFAAAKPLVLLFIEDRDASGMATIGLRMFVLSLVPCALNTCFKHYYQGIDRVPLTQVISVLQNFLLTSLSALILSAFFGVDGVWMGFFCGEMLTLAFISAYVFIKAKQVKFTAENFSLLPEDFGAADEDCLEFSITKESDIRATAKRAEQFCLERGLSPKESTKVAICVRELTENVVIHGFTKDKRHHLIEIRLFMKNGKPILRFRDNCVHFDPVKFMKLHKDDEPQAEQVGLRMVMTLAENVNYVNSLGLNNLTVTF